MGHDISRRFRVSLVDAYLQGCPDILGTFHGRHGLGQYAALPQATSGVGTRSSGVLDPGAGELSDRGPPCFWSIRECVSPPVCVRDDACFIHRLIDRLIMLALFFVCMWSLSTLFLECHRDRARCRHTS